MSEFKAQLLGILIVISVFGILLGLYETLTKNTVNQVSEQVSEIFNNN